MFTAALVMIPRTWKQPKFNNRRMDKDGYTYTAEHCSAAEKHRYHL